eukprot:gene15881-11368_t
MLFMAPVLESYAQAAPGASSAPAAAASTATTATATPAMRVNITSPVPVVLAPSTTSPSTSTATAANAADAKATAVSPRPHLTHYLPKNDDAKDHEIPMPQDITYRTPTDHHRPSPTHHHHHDRERDTDSPPSIYLQKANELMHKIAPVNANDDNGSMVDDDDGDDGNANEGVDKYQLRASQRAKAPVVELVVQQKAPFASSSSAGATVTASGRRSVLDSSDDDEDGDNGADAYDEPHPLTQDLRGPVQQQPLPATTPTKAAGAVAVTAAASAAVEVAPTRTPPPSTAFGRDTSPLPAKEEMKPPQLVRMGSVLSTATNLPSLPGQITPAGKAVGGGPRGTPGPPTSSPPPFTRQGTYASSITSGSASIAEDDPDSPSRPPAAKGVPQAHKMTRSNIRHSFLRSDSSLMDFIDDLHSSPYRATTASPNEARQRRKSMKRRREKLRHQEAQTQQPQPGQPPRRSDGDGDDGEHGDEMKA